jgi:excisionase family DNA binding protein
MATPTDGKAQQQPRVALNISEAAAELGCGRDTVYALAREGKLEIKKFGRRSFVTREALQRCLAALPSLQLRHTSFR